MSEIEWNDETVAAFNSSTDASKSELNGGFDCAANRTDDDECLENQVAKVCNLLAELKQSDPDAWQAIVDAAHSTENR